MSSGGPRFVTASKSWDEPQYGIQNIGIEESYGFGVLHEGQAIAVG